MKMTSILLGTAALAAGVGLASAAPLAVSKNNHPHKNRLANRALSVLFDQNGTDSGIATVSQNFESSFDAFDAQGADDFTVSGTSTVKEVDAPGAYFMGSGPATSENVTFFKDKNGHPGKIIAQFNELVGADTQGSLTIDLGKGLKLKSGKTYWISVQANLPFAVSGEWGWENQTTTVGTPANWENPGDGFATGCTTWATENMCIPFGQGDHMFTLRGAAH
jgi:hypothetical protein